MERNELESVQKKQKQGPVIMFMVAIMAACLELSSPMALAAPDPLQTVRTGTDKVLQILREHSGNDQKRRQMIRGVVNKYFDFDEMAKRALGPYWNEQSPQDQREFVKVFSQFLFNTYMARIKKYTDEKVEYKGHEVNGDYATVDAVVAGDRTGRIPIVYRLYLKDGHWRAYDVVIEGVGLINNYRSQFRSILSSESFDHLLKLLRKKNKAYQ